MGRQDGGGVRGNRKVRVVFQLMLATLSQLHPVHWVVCARCVEVRKRGTGPRRCKLSTGIFIEIRGHFRALSAAKNKKWDKDRKFNEGILI